MNDQASRTDIEEYKDFIDRRLLDMAWENNYPINTAASTFCFIEALKKHQFEVEKREDKLVFRTLRDICGQVTSLESSLSLDQISNGWRSDVSSSPRAFQDSIYSIFDRFNKGVEKDLSKPSNVYQLSLGKMRDYEPKIIRDTMEELLLDYFRLYQEHMLVTVGLESPILHPDNHKPVIFDKVVKRFPWDLLNNAKRLGFEEVTCGPTVETLVLEYPDLDLGDFPTNMDNHSGSYHPSENVLDELFLGMYLQELSKEKGYPMQRTGRTSRHNLAILAENNFRALRNGRDIFLNTKIV